MSGCLVKAARQPIGGAGLALHINCFGRLDAAIGDVEKQGGKIVALKHSIGPDALR